MNIPLSPPPFSDLPGRLTQAKLERIFAATPFDADDYLHWDQLRHRQPPPGLSNEEWWWGIKFGRLGGMRPLPLADAAGRPFQYTLANPLLEQMHVIDSQARGPIAMDEQTTSRESRDRYIVSSLMEEAITSSQLEGAPTTRKVAVEMLRSGRRPRNHGERMILNNFVAMQHLGTLRDQPLTPDSVLHLHRILTRDTLDDRAAAGRLQKPGERRVRVWDDRDGTVVHDPPPAEQLPRWFQDLCEFANRSLTGGAFIPPVIRAIVLHFWLAYDHPFVDGNGRTARALFYWAMLHHGYWLAEFPSISRLLRKAPAQYARAFLYSETDDNDLSYFILHQLRIIRAAIGELNRWLARKAGELQALDRRARTMTWMNYRQRALIAHALRHPGTTYTIQSHRRSHDVAYATARSDLLELADRGLLDQGKAGRAMIFRAVPDLERRLRGKLNAPQGA